MKPLIVGLNPSKTGDGRPWTGTSGQRLQELVGVGSYDDFLELFDVTNVCQGDYDSLEARRTAKRILELNYRRLRRGDARANRHLILCGRMVQEAFYRGDQESFSCRYYEGDQGLWLWAFPHPSGLNRFWNDQANSLEASRFLRLLTVGLVPTEKLRSAPLMTRD